MRKRRPSVLDSERPESYLPNVVERQGDGVAAGDSHNEESGLPVDVVGPLRAPGRW